MFCSTMSSSLLSTDQSTSTSSAFAHNCAAFILSVADEADRDQSKTVITDNDSAVQNQPTATKENKSKAKNKSTPPPPSTTPIPNPSPTITRRIFNELMDKINTNHDQIKPKKMKDKLDKILNKIQKAIDAHYDKLADYIDENDSDDVDLFNDDIPIILSAKLATDLSTLKSCIP